MKKLLILALAASMSLAANANHLNENVQEMAAVKVKDQKVAIMLKDGLGKVKISLMDKSGKILHQQSVKVKNDVKVPYDLSQIPEGEYEFLIESESGKVSAEKAVYSVETKAPKEELPLMAYHKALNENSFELTVIGLDQPGVVVQILDQKGKSIFKEKINEPKAFSKVYHLSNLSNDQVIVKVTDIKGRSRNLYF